MKKVIRGEQISAIVIACLSGGAALAVLLFAASMVTDASGFGSYVTSFHEQVQQISAGPEKWLYLALAAGLLFLVLGVIMYFIPLLLAALLARSLSVNHPLFYGLAAMVINFAGVFAQIVAGWVEPVDGITIGYLVYNALPPLVTGVVYGNFVANNGLARLTASPSLQTP